MLKNIEEIEHVKFVSYTGKYPNLCSGVLTLNIDGTNYVFGNKYSGVEVDFPSFWSSGGECGFHNNYSESYVNTEEWNIDTNDIPELFRKYALEIDLVFNRNVPHGCCGGCL